MRVGYKVLPDVLIKGKNLKMLLHLHVTWRIRVK